MKERGLIFNGEMVRAILDGRKTQTRRPVKFPLIDKNMGCELAGNELAGELAAGNYWNSPFGKPGDRLWVRETWADVNHEGCPAVAYRADGDVRDLHDDGEENDPNLEKYWFAKWYPDLISGTEGRWTPSIHMPRWASRITLEITGVRVERLASITEEDARAEGVQQIRGGFWRHYQPEWTQHQLSARGSFVTLWKSIYGEESWQANPWVWVIEFKSIEGGAA
ncbi:morphogenetic protein [Franconibacter pulveris]